MKKRGRHKFQTYILLLCLGADGPIAFGAQPAPASLEEALEPLVLQVWAGLLCLGAVLALVGPRWRGKTDTSGLIIEEVGLAFAGLPSFIYTFILVSSAGWERAAVAGAFVLGFSLAALGRWWEIYQYLKEYGDLKQKIQEEG